MPAKRCDIALLFEHQRTWPHVDPYAVQWAVTLLRQLTEAKQVSWLVNDTTAVLDVTVPTGLGSVSLSWGDVDDGSSATLNLGPPDSAVGISGDGVVALARAVFGLTHLAPTLQAATGLARALTAFFGSAGYGVDSPAPGPA